MGEWAVRECRADTLIYDTVMHNRHCLMGALLSLRASFTIPFDIWRAMCSFSREAVSPDALLPSVPGILTSKISFLKETKRMKVNAQAFQNQFLVFFLENHGRLKNVKLCFAAAAKYTLSFPKISFSCHRLAGARMVVYEKWWSHFGMFIKNRGLLLVLCSSAASRVQWRHFSLMALMDCPLMIINLKPSSWPPFNSDTHSVGGGWAMDSYWLAFW